MCTPKMRALSYIGAEKITFPPKPGRHTLQTDIQTDISVYRVASLLKKTFLHVGSINMYIRPRDRALLVNLGMLELCYWFKIFLSGALSGLMLDLGLLNSFERAFFLFLATAGGSNPAMPYPNPLPHHAGQSEPLLNLTWPE